MIVGHHRGEPVQIRDGCRASMNRRATATGGCGTLTSAVSGRAFPACGVPGLRRYLVDGRRFRHRAAPSVPCAAPGSGAKPPSPCARTSGCSAASSATPCASRTATRLRPRRAGPRRVVPGATIGSPTAAASSPACSSGIDIHQAISSHPRLHRISRRSPTSPKTSTATGGAPARRGWRAAAGQQPGRHLPQARLGRARRRDRRRGADRRTGVAR